MVTDVKIPGIALEAELGHGVHSIVYRGRHGAAACVVKMPRTAGRWSRWVYREAVTFARVRHPGLARVLEVGQTGDLPYLVTELVRGETLAERLALGPLPEDEVIDLGIHLANMLAAVHDAGLIHRDVKPRNVMLDVQGAMRLVDFGFAAPIEARIAANDGGAAAAYAAPEELCVPARVDARADLYALGRVLFESLACRLPHSTDDLAIRAELEALEVGPALARIVSGLVAYDPDDRYPDARALLADLHHASEGAPTRGPSGYCRSPATSEVIRNLELDRIRRAYEEAELGRGAAVVLVGGRGSGKTRLFDAAIGEIREAGSAVFDVACQEGDAPLAALGRLFRRGFAAFRRDAVDGGASLAEAVRAAAGNNLRPLVAAIAPELAEMLGPVSPMVVAANAFAEGAAEFIIRIARRIGPLAICIDDAHWLDAASADVLARVGHRTPEAPLLVLSSMRDDDDDALLHRIAALGGRRIDLLPLDDERIHLLVAAHLGERTLSQTITDRITALADATPLGVLEVVGALLDSGALRRQSGGWRFDAERAASIALSPSIVELAGRRIAELPKASRQVLEAGAILGATFDDGLAAAVLDFDPRGIDFALADARRAGVILPEGAGGHRFVHDCLKEHLVASLTEGEQAALHQRVGDVLAARGAGDVETVCAIARHYAAGDLGAAPARAVEASLAAARAALGAYDDEASLHHLRTARALADRSGILLDAAYHRAVGEAHLRLGDLVASLDAFEAALANTANDATARVTILGRIAWVHQTGADPRRAWRALARAFEAAGATMPIEKASTLVATLKNVARAEIDRLRNAPPRHVDRARAELLLDLHYQNARLGLEYDRPIRFFESTLQALELADALGPSRGEARARAHYALLLTMLGRPDAAEREMARAERIAESIGQPAISAYCLQLRAVVAAQGGDFSAALARFGECLDRYGPWLELNEYCRNVVNAEALESLRGRPLEGLAWIERAVGRLKRTPLAPRELTGVLCLRAAAARAAVGQDPNDDEWLAAHAKEKIVAGDRGRFYRQLAWGPRARLLVEQGDVGAPLDALVAEFEAEGRSRRLVDPSLFDFAVAVARGRVEACAGASMVDRAPRLRALKRSAADLRAAAKLPLLRAHAALVSAEVAWLEGSPAVARRRLAEAEALAHDEGCSFVVFGGARLRARLARDAGRPEVARDAARLAELVAREHGAALDAQAVRIEFGLPEPPALSRAATASRVSARSRRQLSALLNVVSARGADLRVEQQSALLLDELVNDFVAERALLLFQSAPGRGHLVIGRDRERGTFREADGWQEALLRRVRDRGDMWPMPGGGDADLDGRVLAAPLFVGDRAVGALAFERDPAAPPFESEDRELLLVLSHQVPVVLEAARLLAEREQLQTSMSQTQKMEALGQLAGGVAHDFNNVLTALQASANAVRDRTLGDPEVGAELDVIFQATRRATDLTRQLLAFSRHRPRPLTPERANELIAKLEPRLRTLVGNRVELAIDLKPDVHTMRGDRVSFEQAILNLASNAREAMPNGGKLTIRTENVFADEAALRNGAPASGDYVCISVADTGHGMTPELLARVFEPFFSTRSDAGASGLGLTTVYAFAKNSGGWVALSSEIQKGTLVELFLPRVDELPNVRPDSVKRRTERGGEKTVLVVDDEEMVRKTVQRMLERAGYRVLAADSASQALALVAQHGDEISLAVLDVLMPGVSGPELGRRLDEMSLPAKVLYMSGFAPESAIVSEAQVGPANVIQKPFATRELLDRVRFLLNEALDEPS